MPRPLSTVAKRAIFAQQTSEVFVILLELEHPNFAGIIRVCSNDLSVSHRGNTFVPFPFEIILPDETDDSPPRVTLRIDNVDRRIVSELRSVVTGVPVKVRLYVVLASSPDTVEVGPMEFSLRDVEFTATTVEGTLLYEDVLNESYPADSFTPARFPALF
ncbi:MAG: DUF1833 domain-containing protein [Deltaproteobacteria bacterium]|nr:MAG: DUF1833 domain-containing protein [Deltaproteobacteria bacterium]